MLSKVNTVKAVEIMGEMFPNATCELRYHTPFELLIAVILSAQTTDIAVNKVTPRLFTHFPTPLALGHAPIEKIIEDIRTIGLYRNKAKNIKNCALIIHEKYHDQVPQTMEELVALPGVGRKTANVVLGEAFNIPSLAVDTHVERVSKRLRIVKQAASVTEVEMTLKKKLPKELWTIAHHRMIFFGRYHCTARKPKCEVCPLLDICQDGKQRLGLK